MQRKLLTLLTFLLIFIILPNVSATCTVTFDKPDYAPGETSTASMQCDAAEERNKAYTLTWYNSSGQTEQIDLGTTPNIEGGFFFENFLIPPTISAGSAILTGTSLEGFDNFTVSEDANALLISLLALSDIILIGKNAGAEFSVNDSNNNSISGAICEMVVQDGNEVPLGLIFSNIMSFDGVGHVSGLMSAESLRENTNNLMVMHCNYDSDGDFIIDKTGVVAAPFTVDKWLDVTVATDRDTYEMEQELFICANVTSLTFPDRFNMHITHQLRCSAYDDNSDDTDRALILSDNAEFDERGINFNQTQMQCKRFIIPEPRYMQGHNNTCYASVRVEIVGETHVPLIAYIPTSGNITITSDTLNLNADWQRVKVNKFTATVNLSTDTYADYNGTGMGNIDLRLHKGETTIKHSDQYTYDAIELSALLETREIKRYSVKDCNGTAVDNTLEFLNDGNVELEIRDVMINRSGCYVAELNFETITGDKMIAVILTFMMLSLFFFGLAYVNNDPYNWANSIRWASIVMSALQIFMMIGAIYGDFAGLDITPLLRVDMLIVFLLGFGMLMVTVYMKTAKLMDLSDTDDKW